MTNFQALKLIRDFPKIMGWYRRSRFAFDAFRSLSSKTVPKNPIRNSNPKVSQCSSSIPPSSSKYGVSGFPLSSPVSRNLGFQFGLKQNQCNPFPGGARRYYYVDRHQVQHFRARGPRRWFQNPRAVVIAVLVGSSVFITVYVGNLETVPYTKRKHLVLLSRNLERQLGESNFQDVKKEYKGKILPAIHPDSVRVRLISKKIIEALQRGLSPEKVWSDPGFVSETAAGTTETGGQETLVVALSESNEEKWAREDEILDDKWVQESRKKGRERGSQSDIAHLEGINWEVLVVNEPHVNAFCLPGGKVVVFTGLFNHFKTDAEIATIIGHEVFYCLMSLWD